MQKRLFTLLLISIFILSMTSVVFASQIDYKVAIDGETVVFSDQQPYMKNERIMVPVRAPLEALGATVSWDGDNQTVIISKGNINAKFWVGKSEYLVNDEKMQMDVSPENLNGRVAFPIRYCAEAIGAKVDWDEEKSMVVINAQNVKEPMVTDDSQVINISKKDDGKLINIFTGDKLQIEIESNPTTGYMWYMDKKEALEEIFIIEENFITANQDLVGSPGVQQWIMQAKKADSTVVVLSYMRPWETNDEAIDIFGISVNIEAVDNKMPVYSLKENGKEIIIEKGEKFKLELAGNPTTGYLWDFIKSPDEKILTYKDEGFMPESDAMGSPGSQIFIFQGIAQGKTEINMVYADSWSDEIPSQTLSINVSVK